MTHALEALLGERFALLEPDGFAVLACASLLGYRFEVSMVAACSGLPAARTRSALERTRSLDLIVRETRRPAAYRFRHALIQAAVRDSLSEERRRAGHARIASVLEELPDARRRVEQLAHHWSAAGDALRASYYCECAAQAALRLGAFGDAAAWRARVS